MCGHRRSARPSGWSRHDASPSVMGLEHLTQYHREVRQVAVVYLTAVELTDELSEHRRPVPAGRYDGRRYLHVSLDDLDRRVAGSCGARLLPSSVPAGGRTPLRDGSAASGGDGPPAPAAGRRRRPSSSAISLGDGRRRSSLLGLRALSLLAPPLLPLTTSRPVASASAVPHACQPCRRSSSNSSPRVTEPRDARGVTDCDLDRRLCR